MKQSNRNKNIEFGCRIPREYFVTDGSGESDITIHAGSYHLALKEAGIEMCNIMVYSSIMPEIAKEIKKPTLVHGSVMETIMAVANAKKGKLATAGIVFGWLHDRKTGKRYGGLVCEYNGDLTEAKAGAQLRASLDELYYNGFSEKYELKNPRLIIKSIKVKRKYGTALVAICFTSYVWPKKN